MNRIAIVGAGVSGLTLATHLSMFIKAISSPSFVTIFQSNPTAGGRTLTREAINKQSSEKYFLDVGANLIDFENENAYKDWLDILPKKFSRDIKSFTRPFLLYEDQKFRKGDYEKNRYFYQGGFNKLIGNLASQINTVCTQILFSHEVQKIMVKDKKVIMTIKDINKNQTFQQQFTKVYLSCPPPIVLSLLQNVQAQNQPMIKDMINYCSSIKYTKQLSVGFLTMKDYIHQFSCILFKNHPVLSFICSHQEKYGQNTFVAQIVQEFSQKYFEQPEQVISNLVYESLPKQIKEITFKDSLLIHRWPISLIKPTKNLIVPPKNQLIEFIGDSIYGKSRVSSSIQSVKKVIAKL